MAVIPAKTHELQIVSTITDFLFLLHPSGRIVTVNKAAEELSTSSTSRKSKWTSSKPSSSTSKMAGC